MSQKTRKPLYVDFVCKRNYPSLLQVSQLQPLPLYIKRVETAIKISYIGYKGGPFTHVSNILNGHANTVCCFKIFDALIFDA